MENRTVCEKHKAEKTYFCNGCKDFVCSECVDEHTEAKHNVTHVIKYASTFIIPDIAGKMVKCSPAHTTTASVNTIILELLNNARNAVTGWLSKIDETIARVKGLEEIKDQKVVYDALIQELESAITAKAYSKIAEIAIKYNAGAYEQGLRDSEMLQLRALMEKQGQLATLWATEATFLQEAADYITVLQKQRPQA